MSEKDTGERGVPLANVFLSPGSGGFVRRNNDNVDLIWKVQRNGSNLEVMFRLFSRD